MVNVLTAQYQLCLQRMCALTQKRFICICIYSCILLYIFVFTYLYVYFKFFCHRKEPELTAFLF